MLKRLLGGTEFSQLLDMVSPSFFEVLPARDLWRQGNELRKRYKNDALYTEALNQRAKRLAAADIGVTIGSVGPGEELADPTARGEAVLRLYFQQILAGGTALIDLRRERFADRDGVVVWDPSKITIEWQPDFHRALREMYEGFYRGDDARFTAALDTLGLRCAEATFRKQFGEGDQRAVRFEMKSFVDTFHEAFVSCRDSGDSLHPNFIGLGIYLAFLYDHLESLGGGPFDVRAAYFAAARTAAPESEAAVA